MRSPSRGLLAVYFIAIAVAWVTLSTADYNDARRRECAGRTNAKYFVSWDSTTDTCKKVKR